MPYIKQEDRKKFSQGGCEHFDTPMDYIAYISQNAGDLNYAFSTVLNSYISKKGESYATYNEIVGVLECIKLELYRRHISPYEDKKILENGDVAL